MAFSRQQLIEAVWGETWVGDEHLVNVHIGHLRRKLSDDAAKPRFVRTVPGVGYKMAPAISERPSPGGRLGFAGRLLLAQGLVLVAGASTSWAVAFAVAPGSSRATWPRQGCANARRDCTHRGGVCFLDGGLPPGRAGRCLHHGLRRDLVLHRPRETIHRRGCRLDDADRTRGLPRPHLPARTRTRVPPPRHVDQPARRPPGEGGADPSPDAGRPGPRDENASRHHHDPSGGHRGRASSRSPSTSTGRRAGRGRGRSRRPRR